MSVTFLVFNLEISGNDTNEPLKSIRLTKEIQNQI